MCFSVCVCVCHGEAKRADAGQGDYQATLDNTQVADLGGFGCDAVPQSTTSYVHTQTHAATQTRLLSVPLRYRA